MVAAKFSYDDSWYRGYVTNIITDEYAPEESKAEIYYVDFGDNGQLSVNEVYGLKTEYLKLLYQAVECKLAKVKPK